MSNYEEALRLEVSILEALLQRSRCGHARTKYYQRTKMALRAIQSYDLLEFQNKVTAWKEGVLEQRKGSQSFKRKRGKDQWDLQSVRNEKQKSPLFVLDTASIQTLHAIHKTLQEEFLEVLSRLEYASEPLFLEVSRGFFLPFCTVALGAIGRIRVFLMRMGHAFLDILEQVKLELTSSQSHHQNQTTFQKLFLSTKEIAQLRIQFTEPETTQKPISKQERFSKLRESIGFPDSTQTQKRGRSSARNEETELAAVDDATGTSDTQSEKKASSDKASDDADLGMESNSVEEARITAERNVESSVDDNDLGQAVLSAASSAQEMPGASSLDSSRSDSPGATLSMMKALNEKSKKKKRKKEKQSAEEGTTKKRKSKSSSSSKDSRSGGKKSKKKKEDFFDDLFG